jgi:hypothetical protein
VYYFIITSFVLKVSHSEHAVCIIKKKKKLKLPELMTNTVQSNGSN